jgi:aldehyde dehydrogenase (NAD+)
MNPPAVPQQRAPAPDPVPFEATLARLRATFDSGRTRSAGWRRSQLDALRRMLAAEADALYEALWKDLHKPRQESWLAELSLVDAEAAHAAKNLASWMRPRRVRTPLIAQPGSSRIEPEPLGVVLVIGAWNYPLLLTLSPMIGALAAGNCVVVKPSEIAAHTSSLIARLLPAYLDPDAVAVVEGGVDATTELLSHRFDHILYTGNAQVGRIVMTAAARHLTPVTLELGGKSPAIVCRGADTMTAARRIAWGKWMNAGQICVAPDYALVDRSIAAEFVEQLRVRVDRMYGSDPRTSPDYCRIVSDRHVDRLAGYLREGRTAFGGEVVAAERYVAPTVLVELPPSARVLREEVFGPILPIVEVDDVDAAVAYVNARAKPLALYAFGDRAEVEAVVSRTAAGMVCTNDVAVFTGVPELPFGGVGESGMGGYGGSHGFRTFSHMRAVFRRGRGLDPDARYAPYGKWKWRLLKLLR